MWPAYDDIRERAGEPTWWAGGGVPRYGVFTPEALGIYCAVVAFVEIACQHCGKRFDVAVEYDAMDYVIAKPVYPAVGTINSFHYGDPPRHSHDDGDGECTGNTMNVDSRRVKEFWISRLVEDDKPFFDRPGWRRDPDYEVVIDDDERDSTPVTPVP